MKNSVRKSVLTMFAVLGLLITACDSRETVTEPSAQIEETLSQDAKVEEAVLNLIAKNAGQAVVVNDLAKIAVYGSPEGVEEADDLIGLIQNDSVIVYEGENYSTEITYDVKYKIGNRVVEEYSPLADTALVHYTLHSTYSEPLIYHGERYAESVEFKISGIKMPTTYFQIDMLSEFTGYLEYELQPHVRFYANGNSFFNDVIVNIYNNEIESGSGGVQFDLKMNNATIGTYFAEIEFLGNNEVKVTINEHEYTFTLDLGEIIP